ncbi:hypothetical protein ACFL21_01870 [Patescibacteria group bacterium]
MANSYPLVRDFDPKTIEELTEDESVQRALSSNGDEGLSPEAAPHVIRELMTGMRALETIRQMIPKFGALGEKVYAKRRAGVIEIIQKYGKQVSLAYKESRRFCLESNFKKGNKNCEHTLANFDVVSQELLELRAMCYDIFQEIKRIIDESDNKEALCGVAREVEADFLEVKDAGPIKETMEDIRDQIFSDPSVRLIFQARNHAETAALLSRGVPVVETPTVIRMLNVIHSKVYGAKPKDAVGMALGGPPGLGKTEILNHYIRSYLGVEPASIDIDPGQSAFTLMAKPKLVDNDPVSATLQTLEQLESMELDMLLGVIDKGGDEFKLSLNIPDKVFEAKDPYKLRKYLSAGVENLAQRQMANVLSNLNKRGLYEYGPIYEAMEKNVPVVLNEVQQLKYADFLHSLLTAIPATDEEAGPMPTHIPVKGKSPEKLRGWFFSTLTGGWMRVPHRFRIFFTGNVGPEFGNQGLPPALSSRIGDRFEEMPLLPTEELIDLIWAWTSETNGQSVLTTADAAKLYHLLTEVIPEIDRLNSEQSIENQKVYFSIRTLGNIAKALNPEERPELYNQKKILEEAIFDGFIKPAIVNRFIDSLEIVTAVLYAAGYISDFSLDKITKALPQVKTDQLKGISQDVGGDKIRFSFARSTKDTYKEKCLICGIERCPAHREPVKEHIEDLTFKAKLLDIGLERPAIKRIVDFQGKMVEKKQWHYLLESQVHGITSKKLKLTNLLTKEQLTEFNAFLGDKLNNDSFNEESLTPQKALMDLIMIRKLREIGLGLRQITGMGNKIQAYLDLLMDKYLNNFEGFDGVQDKDVLNADQLSVLRALDLAVELGYKVDIKKYEALPTLIRRTLVQKNQEMNSFTKKRKSTIERMSIDTPYEYVKLLGVSQRMFGDNEPLQKDIKDIHLTNKVNNLLFTVFSVCLGDSDKNPGGSGINVKPKVQGKKGKKRFIKKAPIFDEVTNLGDDLDKRRKLVELIFEWKELVSEVISEKELLSEAVPEIMGAQKVWIEKNLDQIIDKDLVVPYMKFVSQLSRTYGLELSDIIDRLISVKIVEAPPLRDY